MEWIGCPHVERIAGKLSGQPVIVQSRVRPDDLVANRDEGIDWLAENYALPLETVAAVLAFHDSVAGSVPHPA